MPSTWTALMGSLQCERDRVLVSSQIPAKQLAIGILISGPGGSDPDVRL